MKARCAMTLILLAGSALASDKLRDLSCEPTVVEGQTGALTRTTVLTIDDPGITLSSYAVSGTVRYSGIERKGYLEMWSYFRGGGAYFSRTLGAGTMAPLEGDSGWRAFSLQMILHDPDSPRPERLVVNVVLPGAGRVELDQVSLAQEHGNFDPPRTRGHWWSRSTGGLVGKSYW